MNYVKIEINNGENLGFRISRAPDTHLRLKHVEPSSIAYEAGLRVDDYIMSINGIEIKSLDEMLKVKKEAGDKLIIEVKRITARRYSSVEQANYRDFADGGIEIKSEKNLLLPPRKISLDQRRPKLQAYLPMSKLVHNNVKAKFNREFGSSVPLSQRPQDLLDSSRYDPLREKSLKNQLHASSELNIYVESESDLSLHKKEWHSTEQMTNDNQSEQSNSIGIEPITFLVDYVIIWKTIYLKISPSIETDMEMGLLNYFQNPNPQLKIYPINCLYRYITFDDVLEKLFCHILPLDSNVNLMEELTTNKYKTRNHGTGLTNDEVLRLLNTNILKMEELIKVYNERKIQLVKKNKELKQSLNDCLKSAETINKMHKELDNICTKIQSLIDFLISMATSISIWKLNVERPHLYQDNETVSKPNFWQNWQKTFNDFRDSEKKIMKQIINLSRLFQKNCDKTVLSVFDKLFSENIEISLCLSILNEKYRKDKCLLNVFPKFPQIHGKEEQFV